LTQLFYYLRKSAFICGSIFLFRINRKSIRQRRAYQKLHGAAAGIRMSEPAAGSPADCARLVVTQTP
jgi:hypothetical protein